MTEQQQTREELTAALADVKAGDHVVVLNRWGVTLTGKVRQGNPWLMVGDTVLRYGNGETGDSIVALLDHTPAPEPLDLAARYRDRSGHEWAQRADGRWCCLSLAQSASTRSKVDVDYGPLARVDGGDR